MKLKKDNDRKKLRGIYYTPLKIAEFLTDISTNGIKPKKILEPSCGNGVFVGPILEKTRGKVVAIDIQKSEIEKLNIKYKDNKRTKFIKKDFFKFYKNCEEKYDLIIGNPPYIRYQYLTKSERKNLSDILISNGLKSNKLINAWVGFVVACSTLLKKNGVMSFVIPAEIMQVGYAKQIRKYIKEQFGEVIVIAFNKLVFEDIEQEVVLLICKKTKEKKGIKIIQFENVDSLNSNQVYSSEYIKISSSEEKWTQLFAKKNLSYFDDLKNNSNFSKLSNYCKVNVGITTGNNDYFSLDNKTIEKYDLSHYCLPLIGKSSHIRGLFFDKNDLEYNTSLNKKSKLLYIPEDETIINKGVLLYLKEGENNKINEGYKCTHRNKWYSIPSVWSPELFLLRRNNLYPKLIINKCEAVSTDTMHRIIVNKEVDKVDLVLSYYNSVSFATAEISGRSYGGGVLEILPREAENIFVANIDKIKDKNNIKILKNIDKMLRNNENIEKILDYSDYEILYKKLHMTKKEINTWRKIWKDMQERRLSRGKKE